MKKFPNIPDKFKGLQRKDVPKIEDVQMGEAILWSKMSKDPSTQVGASLYSIDNRVLSCGYNGTPVGWPDEEFPWGKDYEGEDKKYEKYNFVVHAEANLFLNYFKYNGNKALLSGTTLYVTLFPCSNCAKLIVKHGIKKVVYLSDKYNYTPDNIISKNYLKEHGVEYEQFESKDADYVKISLSPETESMIKWKGKQRGRRK